MYDTFDEFLRQGITRYYERGGRQDKIRFVAFLLVTGEALPAAIQAVKDRATPGKVAAGVAGAVALRWVIRWVLGGPLGVIVTAASLWSLVGVYMTHQESIRAEIAHTRDLVDRIRRDYDRIQARYQEGRYDLDERNLMIDGLMGRLLQGLSEPPATQA